MIVSVVSLSHPNSREWYLLYVKCLCLLSRYLSPSSREWHLLYVMFLSVVSLSQSSSLASVICVCCLVISAQ